MRLTFVLFPLLFSALAPAQAAANPIGTSCLGTGGSPTLTANQGPWLNETITFTMSNLPAVPGFAFLVFGGNDRFWNGMPLPADLGFLNAPGCNVYVSPEAGVYLPHSVPTVSFSFRVPDWSFLLSCRILCQALVCDTRIGNGIGATTTNALELLFGRR